MTYNDIMTERHRCFLCDGGNLRITETALGPGGKRALFSCPDCQGKGALSNMEPWLGKELPLDTVRAISQLAGITIEGTPRKLTNGYWGEGHHPWWFVKTAFGYIEIGWRKRVISIDWSDCAITCIVTEDDVTKDGASVHAYSTDAAVQYLRVLAEEMAKAAAAI